MTNTMSPYAPIRLQNESWWNFARQGANRGHITPLGQISAQVPEVIMQQFIMPAMAHAKASADQDGDPGVLGHLFSKLLGLRHWVPLVGQYSLCGKQIFDMDDDVISMLRKTDVSDCNLQDWKPPYDAFFVRFGKQQDIKLQFEDDFEYLDGAFIAVTPWDDTQRRIKFGLTTTKADGSGVMMPGYFVDFTPDEQKLSPREAVDAFIERKCAELDADDGPAESAIITVREIRKGELKEGAQLLRDAVELIVNSLFYIEAMGTDKELVPGRDVPPDMLAHWLQTPQLRRYKATQKLEREGYTMVRMMGDEIRTGSTKNADSDRRDLSTHWRKGHWRRQHFGPQNSQLKRVWIRPVLVNPSEAAAEPAGHIYVVSSGNARH